jgi:hypothetical protein
LGSSAEAIFHTVENAHQEARRSDRLSGLGIIAVADLAMTGWVPQHGIGPGEQCASPLLLSFGRRSVGQRGIRPERFVHQVDAEDLAAESGELADPYLYSLHRREDRLIGLADLELRACLQVDKQMQSGL